MEEMSTKEFIYKYFHWIIIFFACITIPFISLTLEKEYQIAQDNLYNFMIEIVENNNLEDKKSQLLELMNLEEEAQINLNYNKFISFISVLIGFELINFLYLALGMKIKLFDKNKYHDRHSIIFAISIIIIECVYLFIILIAFSKQYISDNYWTLFFINMCLIIILIITSLLGRFLLKGKKNNL